MSVSTKDKKMNRETKAVEYNTALIIMGLNLKPCSN